MSSDTISQLKSNQCEKLLKLLVENSGDVVFRYSLADPVGYDYISPSCLEFTGYSQEEFHNNPLLHLKIIHPEDRDKPWTCPLSSPQNESRMVRLLHKTGRMIWAELLVSEISQIGESPAAIEGIVRNITTRIETEEKLRDSETKFRELADSLPETVFETDSNGMITYLSSNFYYMFGYPDRITPQSVSFSSLIHPDEREKFQADLRDCMRSPQCLRKEYLGIKFNGDTISLMVRCNPIIHHDIPTGLRGFIIDITQQKKAENYLRFLSLHDSLTGLYNRFYFEETLEQFKNQKLLPGVIVVDVDGLKIVNDTFGHPAGDAHLKNAASVLKRCTRPEDMIARIGGDEFVLLLPETPQEVVKDICTRIRQETAKYNESKECILPLSISIGSATMEQKSDNIYELFKRADYRMYRDKVRNRQTGENPIIQTLVNKINEKDPYSKLHAERLKGLILEMAPAMKLSTRTVSFLCLFALYHDIGKAGIEDKVLIKPRLSAKEKLEMQRHCEIGHRIALSSTNLAPIADWILKHHEWWNGQGYPLSLKKHEIPFECRWLAILHEFDTMVNPRPQNKVYGFQEAIRRLKRLSGTKFDPSLVKTFIDLVNSERPYNSYSFDI